MPLYNIHTHEYLSLQLYDQRGRLRPEALRRFSAFARSHRTGQWIPIHWRVLVLLYDLFLHFGQPQVTICSGYRPDHSARSRKSRHASGHALDFYLDGVPNRDVVVYLLRHQYHMGVGFYPNSYHVHLDVRPRNAFWVDYSGPGEKAIYSRSSSEDFWSGRARRGYVPPYARWRARAKDSDAPEAASRRQVAESHPSNGRDDEGSRKALPGPARDGSRSAPIPGAPLRPGGGSGSRAHSPGDGGPHRPRHGRNAATAP